MGYHDQSTRNHRAFAIGAVAVIHAAAVYALLTGLAVKYIDQIMPVFEARNIPVEVSLPPADPPPDPDTRQAQLQPQPVPQPSLPLANIPLRPAIDLPPLAPPADYLPKDDFALPVTPPTQAFSPRRAVPGNSPGNWATASDYPSRDLREGNQGVTRFTLAIGADGRVQSCNVVQSSGFAGLDEATCRHVMRRARFKPATDGSGQPVAGEYSSSIRWEIPED